MLVFLHLPCVVGVVVVVNISSYLVMSDLDILFLPSVHHGRRAVYVAPTCR